MIYTADIHVLYDWEWYISGDFHTNILYIEYDPRELVYVYGKRDIGCYPLQSMIIIASNNGLPSRRRQAIIWNQYEQ